MSENIINTSEGFYTVGVELEESVKINSDENLRDVYTISITPRLLDEIARSTYHSVGAEACTDGAYGVYELESFPGGTKGIIRLWHDDDEPINKMRWMQGAIRKTLFSKGLEPTIFVSDEYVLPVEGPTRAAF